MLPRDAQRLAARREHLDLQSRLQRLLGEISAGVDQMFAVVEDEKQLAILEMTHQRLGHRPAGRLLDAKRAGDGLRHELCVAHVGEFD